MVLLPLMPRSVETPFCVTGYGSSFFGSPASLGLQLLSAQSLGIFYFFFFFNPADPFPRRDEYTSSLLSPPKVSLTKFCITTVLWRLCRSLLLSQPLVSVMNDLAGKYCYPVRNDHSTGSGGVFMMRSQQPLVCKRYPEFSAYP